MLNTHCTLCGQELPQDGNPCGCGKRIIETVTIPKSKLREWRRGLSCVYNDVRASSLSIQHAAEITQEIEGYLNG